MSQRGRPLTSVLGIVIAVLLSAAVGTFLGVAGAFVQAQRSFAGPVTVPWGTALTLMTLVFTMRAVVAITSRRLEAAVIGAAWVIASLVFSAKTSSGDLVISSASWSVVYLFGGVVLVGLAASLPPRHPRPVRHPQHPQHPSGAAGAGSSDAADSSDPTSAGEQTRRSPQV